MTSGAGNVHVGELDQYGRPTARSYGAQELVWADRRAPCNGLIGQRTQHSPHVGWTEKAGVPFKEGEGETIEAGFEVYTNTPEQAKLMKEKMKDLKISERLYAQWDNHEYYTHYYTMKRN